MNESELKQVLRLELESAYPRAVIFRFEDRLTHGIPDFCINVDFNTAWLEIKYAKIKSFDDIKINIKDIQIQTIRKLSLNSRFARFVIYVENEKERRTYILTGNQILLGQWGSYFFGFNHKAVIEEMNSIMKLEEK